VKSSVLTSFLVAAVTGFGLPAIAAAENAQGARLQGLAEGGHRSEAHQARNQYRNPLATLSFFGLTDDMAVVEIAPGGSGWYTEILAPFLRERGTYYAASYDPESEVEYQRRNTLRFEEKLAGQATLYDKTIVTVFSPPEKLDIAPADSVDMVLTFRNMHGWIRDGVADEVLAAAFRVLKPGGVLGIVQHRGDPAVPQDPKVASGYVNEDYAVSLVEAAGFRLAASAGINANPSDTRDHPEGVWTLPPTLELGDKDRARYVAIGESDRMTLKFVKPGGGH